MSNRRKHTSDHGLEFITFWEGGVQHTPINDVAGNPTIGVGHKILPGEHFVRITDQEAMDLLRKDVAIAEDAIRKYVTRRLTQNAFDALVSFIFNNGPGAFIRSHLLTMINAHGSEAQITYEFDRWVFAGGRPVEGLKNRRAAEAKLFFKS